MANDAEVHRLVVLGLMRLQRWYPAAAVREHYWTRKQTNQLITTDIPNVCSAARIACPPGLASHVWLMVSQLHEANLLHPDSDLLDQIRQPLRCFGKLDAAGRRTDAVTTCPSPCRCYWPTRKQIDLGLEEVPPPMPDSFTWYKLELSAMQEEWRSDAAWWETQNRADPRLTIDG